jgi:Ca2+/Na+ antiporter
MMNVLPCLFDSVGDWDWNSLLKYILLYVVYVIFSLVCNTEDEKKEEHRSISLYRKK